MAITIRLLTTLFMFIALLTLTATGVNAEEAEADAEAKRSVQYIPLKPAFVTNYQADKLRYFQADVTLTVRGSATVEAIERHTPYIRHKLVMLFSAQGADALNSVEGKSKLQEDALNQILEVLEEEKEPTDVEGVLFTSFIVE